MSKGFQVVMWGDVVGGGRLGSLRELGGDRAEVLAVGLGDVLLERGRLARAVGARQRARAVGRAAVGGIHVEELGRGVAEGHEDHAVVRELRDERERRRLLRASCAARRADRQFLLKFSVWRSERKGDTRTGDAALGKCRFKCV